MIRPVGPGERIFTSFTGGRPTSDYDLDAVAMNITAVDPTEVAYVAVSPEGTPSDSSSLKYEPGQIVPNAAISPVAAERGAIEFRNSAGIVDIIVDVSGFFDNGLAGPEPVTRYRSLPTPARVGDSHISLWGGSPFGWFE